MRTPPAITLPVQAFAHELAAHAQAIFVELRPVPDAATLDCFAVVERAVTEAGGERVLGWRIWENVGLFLEAEFHAVWRQPHGALIDITPAQDQFARVLFVPDGNLTYEGRQVNSRWRLLSGHPAIADFIAATASRFELLNRGSRAEQYGEIALF